MCLHGLERGGWCAGRNMAFLIRAIAREREAAGLPETEPQRIATNFIR